MKIFKVIMSCLLGIIFVFLFYCTILSWDNIFAKEKKEFTRLELDNSYNAGFNDGKESTSETISDLMMQYKTLNHTLEHLQKNYVEIQDNYNVLANQKIELESIIEELQVSNEEKIEEIADLNIQLQNVNIQISQLETERIELNNTITNLNNQVVQLEQQLKDAGLTFDCYKCHTSGSISQGCSYCDVKGTINHENETTFVQVGDNLRGKTIGVSSVRINFEGMEDYIESNTAYGDLANKVRSIAGAYGGLIMPDDKDYIVVSMGENAAIPYREVCPNCNGSMFEQITCPICLGEGKTDTEYIVCPECNGMNYSYSTCDDCQGLGHKTCTNCNGLGTEQCYECGSDGVYDDHQICQDCGSWVYPNSETGECICSCGSSNFSNTCMSCNGSGQSNCYVCSSSGQEMCSPCMGMGQQYGKCKNCDGEGYVAKMKGE